MYYFSTELCIKHILICVKVGINYNLMFHILHCSIWVNTAPPGFLLISITVNILIGYFFWQFYWVTFFIFHFHFLLIGFLSLMIILLTISKFKKKLLLISQNSLTYKFWYFWKLEKIKHEDPKRLNRSPGNNIQFWNLFLPILQSWQIELDLLIIFALLFWWNYFTPFVLF